MPTGEPYQWNEMFLNSWSNKPYYGYPIFNINNSKDMQLPEPVKKTQYTISVYLDNGNVYEYEVSTIAAAREHVDAIIKNGYRSTPEGSDDLTWYPPHRIFKVKASGAGESTAYRDRVRAT